MKVLIRIFLFCLIAGCLYGCTQPADLLLTQLPSPEISITLQTPTKTPWVATPTPTPTLLPTLTKQPTPTPTKQSLGWTRYPNRTNLRDVLADGRSLWLAGSSGLSQIDLISGEWRVWTEYDGLGSNDAISLAEQRDWLWIGTQGGVSKLNRRTGEWQSYTTNHGLSSNRDVRVSNDGETIWAGTHNGLSWYNPVTDSWESQFNAAGVELAGVQDLLSDGKFLWVSVVPEASTEGTLLRLDKATGDWEAVSGQPGGPPSGGFTLTNNDRWLWAIPAQGVPWEYNKTNGRWRPIAEIDPAGAALEEQYLGGGYHADALWLYTLQTNNLIRYDPFTHQISRYPAQPLAELNLQAGITGHLHTLWFAGQKGLVAFYLETGEWRSFRQGVGAFYRILGDRNNSLLLDTDLGPGFWEVEAGDWQPLAPVGGFGQRPADGAALEVEAQSVWMAQLDTLEEMDTSPQLLYYAKAGVEPQPYTLNPPPEWTLVHLLPHSIRNTLWFLGNRGFLSYNPAIDQWGVFDLGQDLFSQIYSVRQLENHVWVGTPSELIHFDTTSGEFTRMPLAVAVSFQLEIALTDEAIWMLADGLLYRGEMPDLTWKPVELAAPCLDEAKGITYWEGAIWVGGGQGVGKIDQLSGEWECFTPAAGMLDMEFEQIYSMGASLWFSHPDRGLWRYTVQ